MQRIDRVLADAPHPPFSLLFSGADAFGHPDLPALIAYVVRGGATRVGLETDGRALTVGGNAGGAIHAGVRRFDISLLAADDVAGERLYGRADAAGLALQGVAECVAAAERAGVNVAVTAAVPVCAHNLDDVARTVAALAAVGVACVRLDARDLPFSAHASACLVAACDTGMVDGVWVEVLGSPEALPPSHVLHVAGEERE